jgi:carboxyl-terminal processing protease
MRPRTIAASLLFGAALGVGGWWLRQVPLAAEPVLAPVGEPSVGPRLFEQVQQLIATRYVDSIPLDSLYRKAIAGLVDELEDPYSAFLPERRVERLTEQMNGNYAGVGMQLALRDGWITVIEPLPGAPADRAGVLAGDRVVAIAGEATRGLSNDDAIRLLRGVPGSAVAVTLDRLGIGRVEVRLTRESVTRRAVPRAVMLHDRVGYVDVNLFNQNTVTELEQAVDSLVRRAGATALLLDLRGNPGGLLEQGVSVAELFLDPPQRIVELRGRPGTAAGTLADRGAQRWPQLALAVLVDGNSASASEIVAGALQDHDRAIVVGRTSFGKGSAQSVFPMTIGGALRLTTARWYTPLGRSISPRRDTADPDAPARPRMPDDSLRPRFTTPAGRTVHGGGGIVPDVVAGDTATPLLVQAFVRELGEQVPAYRAAMERLAVALRQRQAFRDPLQPVTREMVEALWRDLEQRRLPVTRRSFDAAAPWIARALGYELARVTFGADAEFRRRAQHDPVIARALRLLDGAASPRDPFARADDPGVLVPMPDPTFDD